MKISRNNIIVSIIQVILLVLLMVMPALINYFTSFKVSTIGETLKITYFMVFPVVIVYLVNYYLAVPYLFFKKHRVIFVLANILLIVVANNGFLWFDPRSLPIYARAGYYTYITIFIVLNFLIVGCALGLRYIVRLNDIQRKLNEQKQKNTEAELNWLKNQLNPHFLFNTLNNISSLTQIDADAAQDSISQLSDLLRYALYQSNQKMVPITGEIEFMRNYIDLMRLRCTEKTSVDVDMNVGNGNMMIAPLLFISLIENAFKHGVSNSNDSFIRIGMKTEDDTIIFSCANSNFPKTDKNRSGSGIGIENLRRRLQLIYPSHYEYKQNMEGDTYMVEIRIKTEG